MNGQNNPDHIQTSLALGLSISVKVRNKLFHCGAIFAPGIDLKEHCLPFVRAILYILCNIITLLIVSVVFVTYLNITKHNIIEDYI